MDSDSRFVFVICQMGAEGVCKDEILHNHPSLKLAFSRPGFVTFKCDDEAFPEKFILRTSFARTCGWSLGNLKFTDRITDLSAQIMQIFQNEWFVRAKLLHLYQRDTELPGSRGFEPGQTVLAEEIGCQFASQMQAADIVKSINRSADPDELVFDLVIVEPNLWFIGYHFALSRHQRWPGGVPRIDISRRVVSRAYYKLLEALLWSGLQIREGDCCAEIGASPGGACQLLLEKGAHVIAIDPAELDDEIAKHTNLVYIRARGREVSKRELREVRWLISDMNLTPKYTLDTIAEIVTNQHCKQIRGLVLTMKITDWKLVREIPRWKDQLRGLGFQVVKSRQLAFNRKEICLVAIRDKYALRSSRKSRNS